MARVRIPAAVALVVVVGCASRPNAPPQPPSQSPTPPAVPEAPPAAPTPEPAPAPTDPNDPLSPAPVTTESVLTPGVDSRPITVRGELHPTRVQAAMRTAYPAVRECHQKALEARTVEDKPVRVQLNFEITETGEMTKLTDDSANLNPLFSSCVLRAVMNVKFPPPKRGTVGVTYPLELTKP